VPRSPLRLRFGDISMNLGQETGYSQLVSFPMPNERSACDPKRAAIAELQLALRVALEALDVLEARASNRDGSALARTPAPAVNRFASRVAEGLTRARAAG